MKRFKTVLVVAQGDVYAEINPALASGADLARRNGGRLTLLDIIEPPQQTAKQYQGIVNAQELTDLMIAQRKEQLQKVADILETEGLQVVVEVLAGRCFVEVIRQVIYSGHDLVIKVADNSANIFGGDDFHLMRKCPCPVWILKPGHLPQSQNILAAVDLAMESEDEGRVLNTLIMDLASSLAIWQNSRLYLLSCWKLYGEDALRNSAFLKVSDKKIAAMLKSEGEVYQQRLQQLMQRYDSVAIDGNLVKGSPDQCIPEFVERQGIDTVVMGTVGRSGIPGLFIGNTAETILQSINSSVITVKPSGFKSPVE